MEVVGGSPFRSRALLAGLGLAPPWGGAWRGQPTLPEGGPGPGGGSLLAGRRVEGTGLGAVAYARDAGVSTLYHPAGGAPPSGSSVRPSLQRRSVTCRLLL